MKTKKFFANVSTSLEAETYQELIKQLSKQAPFCTPSRLLRMGLVLIMAVGLDTLNAQGAFGPKSNEVLLNIANTVRNSYAQ